MIIVRPRVGDVCSVYGKKLGGNIVNAGNNYDSNFYVCIRTLQIRTEETDRKNVNLRQRTHRRIDPLTGTIKCSIALEIFGRYSRGYGNKYVQPTQRLMSLRGGNK